MKHSEAVTFAGGTLDRAAHLRDNKAEIARMKTMTSARAMPLWHGKPLIDLENSPSLAWLELDAPILAESSEQPIFMGLQNGEPRFAFDVSGWQAPDQDDEEMAKFLDQSQNQHPDLPVSQKFIEIRSVMADLSHDDAGDAATVKGIFEWHKTHKFCSYCGDPSNVSQAGWQRKCPSCERQHFPRTDPVVIMLVAHGNNVLLGRSPHWPDGMYSLLAGFMEPGESIEEAVRREVFEECAVNVGEVTYLSSQPWPFPSSLMIGCFAKATSTKIIIDTNEIEDAVWVSREDVADAMAGNNPTIIPTRKGSIARFLMDRWLAGSLED